ncbi:MAG: arginine--tRNA ligase, partial [Clostridia bacterium]|nr:arginine--tRNA ligase [Clostridia bacterium]
MDIRQRIAAVVSDAVAKAYAGVDTGLDYAAVLEVPPDSKMGDYAFPCFKLSKALRMGPPMIAQKLASVIDDPDFCTAQAVNGYLNFYLNRANFARETLGAVMAAPEKWGGGTEGNGHTVVLDYSSINIAKRFHIGHLSTTMIGNALCRIYDFLGWKTVSINHLGDWGTQFGKMICAYKHWGNKEEVEREGVDGMTRLYVRFHEEAKEHPELEDEGRAWFKKIEDGDAEAMEIFTWFKEVTLRDAMKVYDMLGVKFDSYAGESFYNDKMDRVVNELKDKGLLEESDGAQIVNLEAYKMPPCLILKRDGATLYATRDIAAALYRKDTYNFDKALYIVAYQQDLHFRQWFKTLEMMGYDWAKDELEHVAFGMVSYEGQTLSTREGHVVYLQELLQRAQDKALAIIEEKNPKLENKAEVARQVGIGAVVYSDLSASRIKDIDFWWDRALNFEGETGPYVQYTFARCCSLLRKAGEVTAEPDYAALCDDEAQAIIRLLVRFPEDVRAACRTNEPFMITRAVTEMAKAYNKYYYEHRILDGGENEIAARVQLTEAVRAVIRTGLYLIGMEAPERM